MVRGGIRVQLLSAALALVPFLAAAETVPVSSPGGSLVAQISRDAAGTLKYTLTRGAEVSLKNQASGLSSMGTTWEAM